MPEARLSRARQSLPEGYQFGDAAPPPLDLEGATFVDDHGATWTIGKAVVMVDYPPTPECPFMLRSWQS